MLVIPKRVIARFNDLTTDEVTDLFLSVQRITRVLEREYRAGSVFLLHELFREWGRELMHVLGGCTGL